jgi:hypothetical protein
VEEQNDRLARIALSVPGAEGLAIDRGESQRFEREIGGRGFGKRWMEAAGEMVRDGVGRDEPQEKEDDQRGGVAPKPAAAVVETSGHISHTDEVGYMDGSVWWFEGRNSG